jgi:CheY-like chemotaxis protein
LKNEKLITTKMAAKLWGVGEDAIRKYKNRGLIKPIKKDGNRDLWLEGDIIRMRHIIRVGKQQDKTLQEILKDVELITEEENLSENHDVKRILIIEDDRGMANIYIELLENCFPNKKMKIRHVEDGLTGVEYAIRIKPHLIMLDLALPEKSGMSVYEELKDNPSTCNTEFIIVSGNINNPIKGAVFLEKPFTPVQLLDVVGRFI